MNVAIISEISVRLKKADDESVIGTGILYHNNDLNDKVYLLTASHCLFEDGDKFQQPIDSICIDIYNPQTNSYQTILCNHINENLISKNNLEDVAVIILDKEKINLINSSLPKIQVIKERCSYSSFHIKGFPYATKGEELDAINAVWRQKMTESNRFQLQLNADYTEHNIKGFSGSGIFLETIDEVYLYGIFTRFREEERGRVIYCQYVESINNILRKNFLPLVTYTYLGENGLNPLFFSNQVEKEIKNLGPRFNEKLNLDLPIAQVFNIISNSSTYHQNIITKIDKWLKEINYKILKDDISLLDIEKELEILHREIKDWMIIFHTSYSVEMKITLLPLVEKVKILNKKISDKWYELFNIKKEDKDEINKPKKTFDTELNILRNIQYENNELIDSIEDLNINLANHPILIIQGEAGCGKSHLLGDIANQRKNQNLPTILLLGTVFNNTTIEHNILEKLDLSCSFKNLLENLNSIGLQINSRVLILIDAINEGAGVDLWKNKIAGFFNEITKYPAIGLILTIRSTYFDDIIPIDFNTNPDINVIFHKGFRGNEYEAVKLFCEHYRLKLPNFPILNPEFSNPLFLHIICESIKDLPDKHFPMGFNGINMIYNLYKESLTRKFEEKRPEYKYQNIISKAIEKLSVALFEVEYNSLDISVAVELFNNEFPKFPFLLSDLIEESVLIKMRNKYAGRSNKDVLFFAYQRLGDFFMAEELLKPYNTKEEIKNVFFNNEKFKKVMDKYQWSYSGVIEAFSILLPEKYSLELFELINFTDEKETDRAYFIKSFSQILFDSLKWREISNIDEKKIMKWLKKNIEYIMFNDWLFVLTELAAIPNHPFNSDKLHRLLLNYSMPKRDSFWQDYLRCYAGYDDNNIAYPLQRLIDWAWLPDISFSVDNETARLVAQTLAWILSSTNITLRDKTTKALVNLLEQQSDVLIKTLITFENIDDLYITERLYAVAYGCILRTGKKDSIRIIAKYIYDTIFKNGNPITHILIRDYARNAIEYANYKKVCEDIDMNLIQPPYNSEMPILPNSENEVKEYKLDFNDPDFKQNYGREQNKIYSSLLGFPADFGHYIVEMKVDDFVSFSFREEKQYNKYLKTLKKEQRENIILFYECMKKEFSFNKKYDYQKRSGIQWTEEQQQYLNILEAIKNQCMKIFENIFYQEQIDYIKVNIFPFFDKKIKRECFNSFPVRYWIVKRVFQLGYDRSLHGEYDYMVSSYNNRYQNKIERIGKKYQWIALYEILAMITDNYKLQNKWDTNSKDYFYKGAWQLSLRNIDPAYVTKNSDNEENEFPEKHSIKEWWDDIEYIYWDHATSETEWVKTTGDLIDPKQVIEKKDTNNGIWIHLQHFVNWEEENKINKKRYEGRWKNLSYMIQAYLIKKSDKRKIINYLKDKNFWGRWLPENINEFSHIINREKFWSPAYFDEYRNNKKIWDTIKNTKYKVIITTESAKGHIENDHSGANSFYNIPCKYIFEKMNLQYASIDGYLKNNDGEIIVMNKNPESILIRKKDFIQFLEENNLEIVWTLLGEKFFFSTNNDESSFKALCGVYYLEDDILRGELKVYDRD